MKSISAEVVFNHMTPEALVDFMVSLAGDTNLCNELYSRAGLKLIASVGKKEADRLLAVAQMKAISQNMMHANMGITDGLYGKLAEDDLAEILSNFGE